MKHFSSLFKVAVLVLAIVAVAYALEDYTGIFRTKLRVGTSDAAGVFVAYGDDSIRVQDKIRFGEEVFATGKQFATIDSFTTTAALDTVVMSGASVGDVVYVVEMTPLWSATPDTNVAYSAFVLNTDSVCVRRVKMAATADLKSAAIFAVMLINKP